MFVLRTARQITSSCLDLDFNQVVPETPLERQGEVVLAELLAQVMDGLAREQSIELSPDISSRNSAALVDSVGFNNDFCRNLSPLTVGDAAWLTTKVAVHYLVGHRLDIPPRELSSKLNFALDLGADSLTRVDLVLLFEEALDISVPDDSMSLVQTIGDAELFAILYDRTREEISVALNVPIEQFAFDTPLAAIGDPHGEVALVAASHAAGMRLDHHECAALQDAVRLAFLSSKLRDALAEVAGVDPAGVTAETMTAEDLGLSQTTAQKVIEQLAGSMDLGPLPRFNDGEMRTVAAAALTLSLLPGMASQGAMR